MDSNHKAWLAGLAFATGIAAGPASAQTDPLAQTGSTTVDHMRQDGPQVIMVGRDGVLLEDFLTDDAAGEETTGTAGVAKRIRPGRGARSVPQAAVESLSFHVFTGDDAHLLVDSLVEPTSTAETLTDAIAAAGPTQTIEALWMANPDVLQRLSSIKGSTLLDLYDSGTVIGFNGYEPTDLIKTLEVSGSGLGTMADADRRRAFFFWKTASGEDRAYSHALPGDSVSGVLHQLLRAVDAGNQAAAASSVDAPAVLGLNAAAWGRCWTHTHGGPVTGGQYQLNVSAYRLRDNDPTADWYMLNFDQAFEILSFSSGAHNAGPYAQSMNLSTDFGIAPAQSLYEWMPNTTVGGSTTTNSIGGSLSVSASGPQAGISAGVTMSYGQPNVTITTSANSAASTIDWGTSYAGISNPCCWRYVGPPSIATSTNVESPAVIVQVGQGAGLGMNYNADFVTTNFNVTNVVLWRTQNTTYATQFIPPPGMTVFVSAQNACNL